MIRLVLTCSACPEQYDAYFDGTDVKVGYLRLRHGWFRVDVPDAGDTTIYEAWPSGDGSFDDDERDYYLRFAVAAIEQQLAKIEVPLAEMRWTPLQFVCDTVETFLRSISYEQMPFEMRERPGGRPALAVFESAVQRVSDAVENCLRASGQEKTQIFHRGRIAQVADEQKARPPAPDVQYIIDEPAAEEPW